ncbi:MAG: LytTR family DNA-binding domain-containing protein [Vicinamibacterales bacterium]
MTRLRIAIVDDEAPARQVLREYLSADPDVEIVAECANGFEAVKAVTEVHPDLLLLDVQMPKLNGFEVLQLVGREVAVVFATAYDEYALRAFEVHAIDYLLKPFGADRLHEALGVARKRLAQNPGGPTPGQLTVDARPPGAWISRIVIRDGANVHVVATDKVDYIEAQDDYVSVKVGDRSLLKEQPLTDLERQLDPQRFVRIHRSFLMNLDRLARLELAAKDSRVAVLKDGRQLPVSRSGYTRLKELL